MKGKISVEGKGETALLNADKTLKEHKQNRRAEVVIIVN
jgi:flagellar motor protein MotB